jgi:hypothetical protein
MLEQAKKLMEGAYDVHVHANPSMSKCRDTILEVATEARSYGMKCLVYKDLHFPSAQQAHIVSEAVPGIDVIGGVALNGCVGGLNPAVVEATFKVGGKVVWMFTLDSEYTVSQVLSPGYPIPLAHYRNLCVNLEQGGYSVFHKGTETLKDEAREIIALCKQYGGVMETSHLSPAEAVAMVKEGKNQGLERMVITHPNQFATPYSIELQKELVGLGAVVMYAFEAYMSKLGMDPEPLGSLGQWIREVGVDNVVLGTDFGIGFWPSSVQGIYMMIASLLADRFTEDEVSRLVRSNPDRIYGE